MYELFFENLDKHIKLENSEILQITSKLRSSKLKKNESLLKAGEVCKHIYFVNKGCFSLFYHTEAGEEHNIIFLSGELVVR
ncbi:cyclic nucleotide-binding domain-containing protein [Pedobacter sp. UYP1]|jgi:CRP-like cAMP-binding protein|uniref:cyclic nucleotide-binding domain-containing protein n=1 Tax=Pedobacter sp. UYP1 TaxID=1756396 RepID=UPI0033922BB9